jgi:hypothetical protein
VLLVRNQLAGGIALAICLGTQRAGAQGAPAPQDDPGSGRREWSLGAWAGGAPTSYSGHFIGATPGRALALVGLRLGMGGGRIGPVQVEYVAHLIPAAFAYANPVEPLTEACGSEQTRLVRGRPVTRLVSGYCSRRVYGAGAMPVGVQFAAPLSGHLRAFVSGNAGALVFADNVPVPAARRFNFAFDFGGGFEVGTRRVGAVTLGYKLHHISNAWTAKSNPGMDHHVFYLGFVHRLHGGRAASVPPNAAAEGDAAGSPKGAAGPSPTR